MKNFTNKQFAFCISIVFLGLSVIMAFHHELWMDEAYHYLLARDSASVTEIFKNGTQTGHPVLWNIVLFYYKAVLPGVMHMQILHCVIAAVCVFLINRYSPFSNLENVLISFGYFFLYEYNIIAKNYILGFCLLFIALILYDKKKPLLLIAFILAIACNLHLFTLFISGCLFIYICLNRINSENKKTIAIACALMVLGIIISSIQILPSAEHINEYKSYDAPSWLSMERLNRSLSAICKGLLNIPDFRQHSYWNSNLIYNFSRTLCYMMSVGFAVFIYLIFKHQKFIVALFFIPTTFIMLFVYLMPLSAGIRYWGYFYVLLIMCWWLYKRREELSSRSKLFFKAVLFIQFIISIPSLIIEYTTPFSTAKYATLSLEKTKTVKYPLFMQSLGLGPSLSAYTGKKVYYPANKTFESFSYYVSHRRFSGFEFLTESLLDLKHMKLDTCVLVMNEPLNDSLKNKYAYQLKEIAEYKGAIITSENYYLYLVYIK